MGCACCNPCITVVKATVGALTWTCPAGITSVLVECWGGGGGGGGGLSTNGGQGGGGGGYGWAVVSVTPGNLYDLSPGAPGAAAPSAGFPGFPGGDSTFGPHSGSAVVTGGGGQGGGYSANDGGAGGSYSGTGVKGSAGGNGGNFYAGIGGGGGGGGCAGGNGSAGALSSGGVHGTGQSPNFGSGTGDGGDGGNPTGNGGSGYPTGGGGGGAGANNPNTNPAGSGAVGAVRITSCINSECCSNTNIPMTLYATFSGTTGCTCVNGSSVALNWTLGDPSSAGLCPGLFPSTDADAGYWYGTGILCGQTCIITFYCVRNTGYALCFKWCGNTYVAFADVSTFTCAPFYQPYTNIASISGSCGSCTGPAFVSITVTP